ncbi:MAG: crossover junction endodeoxyribonuclease RuvC [Sporomusaceae bacterium]|jgi:crossover junction endodeoxyribonuclease RuvC|nr:crossover junction endodeoxyribonuclease RuvC [Sporomusaceae bacterium]
MLVMGIDPGIAICGYGLVKQSGSSLTPVEYGVIRTGADCATAERLVKIFQDVDFLIKNYRPALIGVEELFFAKNVKTAMVVGEARGVILLAAAQNKVPILEFTPLQVKQSVVGYGRAEKKQVIYMTEKILNLTVKPHPDDAADALAVAICASHHAGSGLNRGFLK